ncbi:hypothetical protein HD806DRAFT_46758 [Xylariaceae sp. AK1471]|nr:hypothetical protein HD806DRAFT_46758 [Xylariaceae sp. AK1471]
MSSSSPLLRPLEQITHETKRANRSPHLRKSSIPHPDRIDALDNVTGIYHHDGPYDAALASRNKDPRTAPLAAVKEGNLAALKATPAVNVIDSVTRHVPLQGTAAVPPGEVDYTGNVMDYEEGADVMREPDAAGGAYRRYADVQYHPEDLKGKGEPSFTVEQDLKKGKKRKD